MFAPKKKRRPTEEELDQLRADFHELTERMGAEIVTEPEDADA